MLKPEFTSQFKKDYKLAIKRGFNSNEFIAVLNLLLYEQPLPSKYNDHPLENSRNYKGVRECHIKPDWLLIYKVHNDTLTLRLIRTGSHSDLF